MKYFIKYKFHILTIIFIIFCIEAFCYLFLTLHFKSNQACNYKAFYKKRIELFKNNQLNIPVHNKLLGWDLIPNKKEVNLTVTGKEWISHVDSKGRRLNPYISSKNVISTYGDSFTFCAEVNDNQTWQYFLSKLTDTNVINYGMGGYGTDQAVLKLERNLKNNTDRPRIVILGLYEEDINRIMSLDRAFFTKEIKFAFKPMFYKEKNKYILINKVPTSYNSLKAANKAYRVSKKYDYWYKYCDKYLVRFPFTLSFINIFKAFLNNDFNTNFYSVNMYKNKEATDKMTYILERFVDLSDKYHFKPVLLVIPEEISLIKSSKSIDYLNQLKQNKKFSKMKIINYKGYVSEHGNRVIADILYQNLKDEINKFQSNSKKK